MRIFLAVVVMAFSSAAWACSCGFVDFSGFVSDSNPKILPSNAKGVLFSQHEGGGLLKIFKGPGASSFIVKDDKNEDVPVSVRKLKHAWGTYYRIEPKKGFRPGASYTFTYQGKTESRGRIRAQPTGTQIVVKIDDKAIEPPSKSPITLATTDVKTQQVSVPEGGMCSGNILARAVEVSYVIPAPLETYKDSLLFFTSVDDKLWRYQTSSCSSVKPGRSDVAFAKDLVYSGCGTDRYRDAIALDKKTTIHGYWGFLEIEDELHETNAIDVTFSSANGECDKSKYEKDVFSGDSAEEICKFARSEEPITASALKGLLKFSVHKSAEHRRCAVEGISPVPYRLQNTTEGEILALLEQEAVPALANRLTDEDEKVRVAASQALRHFTHVWGTPDGKRAMNFSVAFPQMRKALKDSKQDVRIAVAESLYVLKHTGKPMGPALIEAIEDTTKPNYAAPPSLASVDPKNPKTVPTLLKALGHPDGIVRGTVARALGSVGTSSSDVVPALIQAVGTSNSDAIQALGELKDKATPAAPVLLKLARTSEWTHVRHHSMEALVAIGAERKQTLDVIVENMKHPKGEYLRWQSIECLGKMGPDARPAVPAMVALLDTKMNQVEMGSMVRAWKLIGPPPDTIKPALKKIKSRDDGWARDAAVQYLEKLP